MRKTSKRPVAALIIGVVVDYLARDNKMKPIIAYLWFNFRPELIGLLAIICVLACFWLYDLQYDFWDTGRWYKNFRNNTFDEFQKQTKEDISDLRNQFTKLLAMNLSALKTLIEKDQAKK